MSGNIATFLMALGFVMLPQVALSKSIKQSADNKAKIAVVQNYLKQSFFKFDENNATSFSLGKPLHKYASQKLVSALKRGDNLDKIERAKHGDGIGSCSFDSYFAGFGYDGSYLKKTESLKISGSNKVEFIFNSPYGEKESLVFVVEKSKKSKYLIDDVFSSGDSDSSFRDHISKCTV